MKKNFIVLAFIMISALTATAQKADDSKDALAVVNKMFAEMANHNPAGIVEVFYTKDSILTALIRRKDGKSTIMNLTGEAFSKNFSVKKSEIKEDMYAPKVEVDGDLALVSGRYVFFADGKLSHCGVNAFHLVRTDAGWRIAGASSTIDPTACTEQEKAIKPPPVTPK